MTPPLLAPSRDAALRDAALRDAALRDVVLHDAPRRDASPRDTSPRDIEPDCHFDPPADAVYIAEQRRFRRLEASLPVWVCESKLLDAPGGAYWVLGLTRDLSLGGARIMVPNTEAQRLRAARAAGESLLLRYETRPRRGCQMESDFITARIRHATPDEGEGFWIGVQYEDGADEAKLAALRTGLKTLHTRRKWQSTALAIGVALLASLATIITLRAEVAGREREMVSLKQQRQREAYILDRLNRPRLLASRAEGYEAAFQGRAAEREIARLTGEIAQLSSEENQAGGEAERERRSKAEGVETSTPAPSGSVQLGVALPYGYAWPQVTNNLETLLGRNVPQVVIFRDWSAPFPMKDAREARLRAKTLQITWEPWHFARPDAVKLGDIAGGKHDAYLDSWAREAKSFGGELWIRWGHEFNGNWYPWSLSNNDAQSYKAAYRRVVSRFKKAGAWNVRFIWCFNAESVPNTRWNDPRRAYPGDDVVDAVSIDGYNFGSGLAHGEWTSFRNIFAAPYKMATRNWPHKPLFIGETGCSARGGDKARWIARMDEDLRTRFSRVEAVVWFEADKEADWRMTSSPEVLAAARQVWSRERYRRGEA